MKPNLYGTVLKRGVASAALMAAAASGVGLTPALAAPMEPTPPSTDPGGDSSEFPADPTDPGKDKPDVTADDVTLTQVDGSKPYEREDVLYFKDMDKTFELRISNVESRTVRVESFKPGTNDNPDVIEETIKDGEVVYEVGKLPKEGRSLTVSVDGEVIYSKLIKYDTHPPTKGTVTAIGEAQVSGDSTVMRSDTKLKADGFTDETEVKSVTLIKKNDKGEWDDVKAGAPGDEFDVPGPGIYAFKVVDFFGHERAYRLSEMSSLKDKIVIDDSDTDLNISYTVNGKPNTNKFYKDKAVVTVNVKGSSLLQRNIIRVNGDVVTRDSLGFSKEDRTYDVDLSKVEEASDGVYTVEVESSVLFAPPHKETYVVKADFSAPKIDDVTLTGDYAEYGGSYYTKGTASISVPVEELGSGIKDVILQSADGRKTNLSLSDGSYVGVIPGGSDYSIVATDNVGHTTTKKLTDVGLNSNNFIVDSKVPTIDDVSYVDAKYVDGSQNKWITTAPTLKFRITDDNLRSIDMFVNGEKVTHKKVDETNYELNLSSVSPGPNGMYDVNLEVTDQAGNIATHSVRWFVDGAAPSVNSGSINSKVESTPYGNYSRSPIEVSFSGSDSDGSGIKEYRLVDEYDKVIDTSTSGSFTLTNKSGLRIVAVDHLGNASSPVAINTLLGVTSNKFVTDTSAPTVEISSPGTVHGDWYGEDVTVKATANDDAAIASFKLFVNDKEVKDLSVVELIRKGELSFSTSDVKANADGSYNVEAVVRDVAGNESRTTKTFRVDRSTPSVNSFTFIDPGFKEGQPISVDDRYGFYFQGATRVDISVSDGAPSAGFKHVTYTLRNADGSVNKTGTVEVNAGKARVTIPNNFKGYISATVTDNVKHTSPERKPSGVITEDANWSVRTTDVSISTPETRYRDRDGGLLYNSDTTASVPVSVPVSGLRDITWGIGNETLGSARVTPEGTLSGAGWSTRSKDKNLVTGVIGNLPISGNSNSMDIWVTVTDRAGHKTTERHQVSIDKDAPIINVSYNQTNESTYYNSNRTATISIRERNFNPADVNITGTAGSLSGWTNVGGDTWQATMTFADEIDYSWGIDYVDLAGNSAVGYKSEGFTVDKTAPSMQVTYSNNDVRNGKFYNSTRNATISITDRNFDPGLVKFNGPGEVGGWSQNGDTWSANVNYDKDGDYAFTVSVQDKATNAGNGYESGEFTIDTTAPELILEGVDPGVSYKEGSFKLAASPNDKHLDNGASKFVLSGRQNGEIELDGSFENGKLVTKDGVPKERKFDDFYTAKGVAVDLAGNTTEKTVQFSVNRYGSLFKFADEEFNGKYFQELPNDIVLTQTSVDRLDMSKFKIVVLKNGREMEIDPSQYSIVESGGKDGPWVYTITVKRESFTDDGVYQVQLFSESEDGNKESSLQQEYSFVIDKTEPEIIVSGIESEGEYTGLSQQVTVEVRDLSGPDKIYATLNGKSFELTANNGVYTGTVPAGSSAQNMSITVIDRAGNEGTAKVSDFRVIATKLEAFLRNPWVQITMALVALALLIPFIFLVIAWYRRHSDKKARQKFAEDVGRSTSGNIAGHSSGQSMYASTAGSGAALDGNEDGLSTLDNGSGYQGSSAPGYGAAVAGAAYAATSGVGSGSSEEYHDVDYDEMSSGDISDDMPDDTPLAGESDSNWVENNSQPESQNPGVSEDDVSTDVFNESEESTMDFTGDDLGTDTLDK